MNRLLQAAKAVALAGEGTGQGRFRVGAVLFKKNRILNARHNSYKTHPFVLSVSPWPYLHAEAAVILAEGLDNCVGRDIIVTRVSKDKRLTMAKPCLSCMELIKQAGIRRIYYTNWNGELECVTVKDESLIPVV